MSRAFTKEVDDAPDRDLPAVAAVALPPGVRNYVTPGGHKRLLDELEHLTNTGRPEAARLAAQAAAASDQLAEQTQKRRLRTIEARMQFLRQRIEQAEVVDPLKRGATGKVYFGATVRFANRTGHERAVSIVGVDESDIPQGRISFLSPLAKALLGASVADTVPFQAPGGRDELEILDVVYREIAMPAFKPDESSQPE